LADVLWLVLLSIFCALESIARALGYEPRALVTPVQIRAAPHNPKLFSEFVCKVSYASGLCLDGSLFCICRISGFSSSSIVVTSFALSRAFQASDLLDAGDEERTQPISQRRIAAGNNSTMIIRLCICMSLCGIRWYPLVSVFNLSVVFLNILIYHSWRKSMTIPCYGPRG
jgi:hypothetical protein